MQLYALLTLYDGITAYATAFNIIQEKDLSLKDRPFHQAASSSVSFLGLCCK